MKTSNPKFTIVILGRSGSGKGTQAQFILRRLKKQGVAHIETGRFLRELLSKYNNSTIRRAKVEMAKGKIFPDWFITYIFSKEIIEKGCGEKHWVFDGAPRSLRQAGLIDELAAWHGRSLPLVLYVKVNEKEATQRLLLRSRGDDYRRSIKNRMRFFAQHVLPVIRYYKKEQRLIPINGEQSVAKVQAEIIKALTKRLGKRWPGK